MNHFVVLGIHGEKVETVEENVARVRMYVGDKEIDEDFLLPHLPDESGVPKNEQVYKYLLTEQIEKRMKELEATSV